LRAKTGNAHRGGRADHGQRGKRAFVSLIPKAELGSILDNIGLPVSGINLTYDSASPIGNADADVLVHAQCQAQGPTAQYVQDACGPR